jgi:hypothetical protein
MIEKNWSEKEIALLTKLFPFFTNKELVEFFGRSEASIQHKARRLNLRKDKDAISVHRAQMRGEKSPAWRGGRKLNKRGHVLVYDKDSPYADANGYVLEHRKIMMEYLGRPLKDNEVVHHINGIKTDNRIENLQVMDRGEHTVVHHTGMKRSEETRRKIKEAKRRK